MDLFHDKKTAHKGKHFNFKIDGAYEVFPHALRQPHPPLFLASATERSIKVAGQMGFGMLMSSFTPFAELARQTKLYRAALEETPDKLRANPARGHCDVARFVYVAETDAKARRESEAGLMRHFAHFSSGHASGYLGTVSESGKSNRDYDGVNRDIVIHGSPATVTAKLEELREMTGIKSVMLHYPPWYGPEKTAASLELFATEVAPKFRPPEPARKRA
jgi:alkanesulfonate monooxygenase SsuD/methylene tetrahydromethanopterin reductase-like flavin-dependent oxidoreductase (luciferase family)